MPLLYSSIAAAAEDLKLEGNPMRRPKLEVLIEEGVEGLRDWCRHETGVISIVRTRCTCTGACREGGTS
jgi:hypothetical protein